MFCSECGQQNADDNKFCMKCGKKLVTEQTVSSSSEATVKPVTLVSKEGDQTNSLPSVDSKVHVSTELKESGTVTAMSVIGLVFGLIGMLGSFIPCLGSFAFYIALPAAIASGIGLGIAYSQNAKRTFAIVALTISLIGVVISGWQLYSIASVGQSIISESKRIGESANKQKNSPPTPAPSVSEADIPSLKKYIGEWEYQPYKDDVKTKYYIRISKNKENAYVFEWGFKNEGDRNVSYNIFDKKVDNIYLKPVDGKLKAKFTSYNFMPSHGVDIDYNVSLEFKSDDKLLYMVDMGSPNNGESYEATRFGK